MPTTTTLAAFVACALALGCGGGGPSPRPPEPPPEPDRTAAAAEDLRVMLAEVAAKKACEKARGTFRTLEASTPQGRAAVGTLWIRECEASQDGTDITLELSGSGWRWVHREREKLEAKFEVSQQVRFDFAVRVTGTLDAAYAPASHVFTIWFTPERSPVVEVRPVGDVDVEAKGLWAEVLAGAATLVGASPDQRADQQFDAQAQKQFAEKLSNVFSITVDLCTGKVATGFERAPQGQMLPADESGGRPAAVDARLQSDGLLITGPYRLRGGPIEVRVDLQGRGAVEASVMCAKEGARLARAYVAGEPLPSVDALASEHVSNRATLTAKATAPCERVVVVTRPLREGVVTFSYTPEPPVAGRQPLAECPVRTGAVE